MLEVPGRRAIFRRYLASMALVGNVDSLVYPDLTATRAERANVQLGGAGLSLAVEVCGDCHCVFLGCVDDNSHNHTACVAVNNKMHTGMKIKR